MRPCSAETASVSSQVCVVGLNEHIAMRSFNPTTQTWEETLAVSAEHGRIDGLAFSPDGQMLVNGEGSGSRYIKSMHTWDGRTGCALPGFPGESHGPVFS